jgi:catechol 2,3-dioxygenase-like lactoylglutathione lyase family enzyme
VAYGGVTHVALRVPSVQEAERFYQELFGLDVAFREIETQDGWRTLPGDMAWDQARSAGLTPGMCVLFAGGFRLALEQTPRGSAEGALDHVGLLVADSDLNALRDRAKRLGCELPVERDTLLIIHDRYRVNWEVTTAVQQDPRMESNGARRGLWVNLH